MIYSVRIGNVQKGIRNERLPKANLGVTATLFRHASVFKGNLLKKNAKNKIEYGV
jgi:hypothetical protein